MTKDPFVHLHVHSAYSMLDGAALVDKLAEEVARLGQSGFSHGNIHAAYLGWQLGTSCFAFSIVPMTATAHRYL